VIYERIVDTFVSLIEPRAFGFIYFEEIAMKPLNGWRETHGVREGLLLITIVALTGSAAYVAPASGQAGGEVAGTDGITLPQGYRDWALISIARVGGPVNDMRAKLGNDVAIRAYRDGTMPFPDGTIIARLAWNAVTSEENNNALRPALERGLGPEAAQKTLAESFVAGPATNVQFMIKDSKKYASTAGWGFAQFTDGKPDSGPALKTCFSCHGPAKDHDFVFTRYSR
jgi:hypothetical protein